MSTREKSNNAQVQEGQTRPQAAAELQGGTNQKEGRAGGLKDVVQREDRARNTLGVEVTKADETVSSSEGPEYAGGRLGNSRQKTGDTWTGESSDESGNNCSAKKNAGKKKKGRMRKAVTRKRKGSFGQKAERMKGARYGREVRQEAGGS